MESEPQNINEETQIIEFEDIDLSDNEENDAQASEVKLDLNIDHNNRIVSTETLNDFSSFDNCDMRFQEGTVNFSEACTTFDNAGITSDEELEISEEDISHDNMLALQHLNLEGVACISASRQSDISLNYSSTNFKDEYATDAEDISDDGEDYDENKRSALLIKKNHEKLSYGQAVANVISAAQAVSSSISSKKPCTASLSFTDKYSHMLPGFESKSLFNRSDIAEHKSSQTHVTCVDLDSEPHEDGETDTEDFSGGSFSPKSDFLTEKVCNSTEFSDEMSLNKKINSAFDMVQASSIKSRFRGKVTNGVDEMANDGMANDEERKGLMIIDLATDDETLCIDSEHFQMAKRTKKGKLKRMRAENIDLSNESLTDEEFFDIENKEWTETDESGGIRQVTQIKTETSIKLEGEGEGLDVDGDDLVSRTTATTTTRIVTTVTTDHDDQTGESQQVASEDGDDLRHSVEVILNQFMSGDSQGADVQTSQPE